MVGFLVSDVELSDDNTREFILVTSEKHMSLWKNT